MEFGGIDELLARAEFETALERLWPLSEEDPDCPEVNRRVAEALFGSKRYHDALATYEWLAELNDSPSLQERIRACHVSLWAPYPQPVNDAGFWVAVEGTDAEYRSCCIERDGVRALIVWLRGSVSRRGEEVSTLTDTLDKHGVSVGDRAEVAVLIATAFSNADGDEASTLTSVFRGLPCCWVSSQWHAQDEHGRRWDLPATEKLAATEGEALARVIALRAAGRFEYARGGSSHRGEWTERGLLVTESRGGEDRMTSLYHHNRLVERAILDRDEVTTVQWPFPDKTGASSEATRRAARVRLVGDRLVEVDLSPYQTGREAGVDWPRALTGAQTLEELVLIRVPATDDQVLRVLEQYPRLKQLRLDNTRVTLRTLEAIADGAGPALEHVSRYGTEVPREALDALIERRPGLRMS